jgi:hypothetical protein
MKELELTPLQKRALAGTTVIRKGGGLLAIIRSIVWWARLVRIAPRDYTKEGESS